MAVLLAAAETLSAGFFIIMFAGGALASAGVAYFGFDFLGQLLIFLFISLLLLILTRRLTNPLLTKKGAVTNLEALIGKKAKVMEIKEDGTVYAKLNGELWKIKVSSAYPATEGTIVQVTDVEGVTLLVKPIDE